jgi:hypothetical protein
MSDHDDAPTTPYPPQPEHGRFGEEGEEGTTDGQGGAGGHGGRGGRGGIGAQGDPGPRGQRGASGLRGPSGGEQGKTGEQGDVGKVGPQGAPGEIVDMQTRPHKIALFVVVLVTAVSAVFFSTAAANRLDDIEAAKDDLAAQQTAFNTQIDCEFDLLENTLESLKARSLFAQQQAESTLVNDRAQRDYLEDLLNPNTPRSAGVRLTNKYLDALRFKIKATAEQLEIRDAQPYPTEAEIAACRP